MDTSTNQTWIDKEFPGLDYTVTSESDEDYNCIAWAGITILGGVTCLDTAG